MPMPRILMVTSVFPRWERDDTPAFVANLAEDISALGCSVTVLAPHYPGAKVEEFLGSIRVVRFRYAFPFSLEKLCYNGGMIINMRTQKWTKCLLPFFFIAQLRALQKLVSTNHFDLLHSHSLLPQGYACSWIARKTDLPHLTTSHGNDVFGLRDNGMYGNMKRAVLKAADAIIANSSATQGAITRQGAAASKIYLIPSSANISPIKQVVAQRVKTQYKPSDGGPLIIFVGRLIEEKGVSDLIAAISIVAKSFPSVHCIILGEGQDRAKFEQQVSRFHLHKNISFLGWIAKDLITSFISAADIFIGPSKPNKMGWTEAQGLTFVEAMYAKTPIIATQIGGIPDMVKHLKTGILIPPNDAKAIAVNIEALLNNSGLARELTSNARSHYENTFSRAIVSHQHIALYKKFFKR